MERARWNTELSHKKLNFVTCPTFWGHTNRLIHPLFLSHGFAILSCVLQQNLSRFYSQKFI
jgi:hypothetical protein